MVTTGHCKEKNKKKTSVDYFQDNSFWNFDMNRTTVFKSLKSAMSSLFQCFISITTKKKSKHHIILCPKLTRKKKSKLQFQVSVTSLIYWKRIKSFTRIEIIYQNDGQCMSKTSHVCVEPPTKFKMMKMTSDILWSIHLMDLAPQNSNFEMRRSEIFSEKIIHTWW